MLMGLVPSWSLPTNAMAIVCAGHTRDIDGRQLINFKATCELAGFNKVSRGRLHLKQNNSTRAVSGAIFDVKSEYLFQTIPKIPSN